MTLPAEELRGCLQRAITAAYPTLIDIPIVVEEAKDPKHGDYASNIAMRLAPAVKQPPIDVAHNIVAHLGAFALLEKAEVAPPGFINFFVKPKWLMKFPAKIAADKTFGKNVSGRGKKIILEFISANPTGPMTMGNGRGAFAGDTMANIFSLNGWKVTREYYINDIGNQINILAESVIRRYFQQQGIPTEYPAECYQGEYISELAQKLDLGRYKVRNVPALRDRVKNRILNMMIADIKRVTKRLGVKFDVWFRESAIYQRKFDRRIMEILRRHDLLYDKDGATWFRTTAFGDDKDRVLIKADGAMTYFVPDIALHWHRFAQRGFDRELLFLGADHHGYQARMHAAMAALGYAKQLDFYIVQLVRLIKGGQEVKMSKRAGTYVTLDEVLDEVGSDVARFFFLMHGQNVHLDFNLDEAKERSEKNPVYYVQYAHARICSLITKIGRKPRVKSTEPPHASELNLTKTILHWPVIVSEVAQSYEVQKIPFYCMELATRFHEFYTHCRVIDQGQVNNDRLVLVKATQQVLAAALATIGVKAPKKM